MPEIRDWIPNPKQEEFLTLPDECFEALYGGAAGPGKTDVLLMYPVLREFYQHQNFKGIFFRNTFPELEAEALIRAHEIYPQTGAQWQSKSMSFYWPHWNSYMRFGHMEHDKDKKKYDSAEYQYAAFDELTHFTWLKYSYLFSRMRSVRCPTVKGIIRNGTNPGGIGHHWVRKRFVEPYREGGKMLKDSVSGRLRYYLPANLEDNPHLLNNDPDYARNLLQMPPAERAAKMSGDWWTFQGQVFTFRRSPGKGEPDSAQHVIPFQELPAGWPRFLTTDVGFTARTFNLWFAISPDDEIFVYREFGDSSGLVSSWARELGHLSRGENLVGWDVDHTVFEGDKPDIKLVDDIKRAAGLKIQPRKAYKSKGSRRAGMLTIQEYFSWMNDRKKPRLYIMDNCTELIETIPLCVYATGKDGAEIMDVAEFDGDDPYDTFRYGVRLCDRYIKARREGRTSEYREAKIQNLKMSGDWMSYFMHREMERNRNQGIRRRVVV